MSNDTTPCVRFCRHCSAQLADGNFCPKCGADQRKAKKAKTRGNGTGSVYQLPDKSWCCEVTLGYRLSPEGKAKREIRRKKGFKTKKEAVTYLPNLFQQKKQEKDKTFSQLYEQWLPTHRAGKSTLDCYKAAYRYFSPVWSQSIREIDIDDLQACMDDCDKGRRTKENMKALCGLLYKFAIPRHLCNLNLGQYLIVTADTSAARQALPKEALDRIESLVGIVPFAEYVVAHCYLGFRPSELLELQISSFNPERMTLTGGAKTVAGRNRVVPIASRVQPIILNLVAQRASGAIFHKDGQQMSISTYRDIFYSVLAAAGIDNPVEGERHKYTPHACRHTFATMMKNVQGSDKDKLALIGHTSTEMLRHYQDTDLDSLRNIVEALGVK